MSNKFATPTTTFFLSFYYEQNCCGGRGESFGMCVVSQLVGRTNQI